MKANFGSTVRPRLAPLAASQSMGTGWVFWDRRCCIKCKPVTEPCLSACVCLCVRLCMCQSIRNGYTASSILSRLRIRQKDPTWSLYTYFLPHSMDFHSACSVGPDDSHSSCFGNESFGALESHCVQTHIPLKFCCVK